MVTFESYFNCFLEIVITFIKIKQANLPHKLEFITIHVHGYQQLQPYYLDLVMIKITQRSVNKLWCIQSTNSYLLLYIIEQSSWGSTEVSLKFVFLSETNLKRLHNVYDSNCGIPEKQLKTVKRACQRRGKGRGNSSRLLGQCSYLIISLSICRIYSFMNELWTLMLMSVRQF